MKQVGRNDPCPYGNGAEPEELESRRAEQEELMQKPQVREKIEQMAKQHWEVLFRAYPSSRRHEAG